MPEGVAKEAKEGKDPKDEKKGKEEKRQRVDGNVTKVKVELLDGSTLNLVVDVSVTL